MRNANEQQYNRRVQQYENVNLQNHLQLRELEFKKLQYEYNKLMQHFGHLQQENQQLRETLEEIMPQNQSMKNVIKELKVHLESIHQKNHQKEEDSMEQIMSKDKLIEQLTAEIQRLNQKEELRVSDLSSYGQLVGTMDEKNKLEELIQELKQQKLIDSENYEKKLIKKDELIHSLNIQSQQTEQHFKDIISKKMSIITSLQQEYSYIKKTSDEQQQELKMMREKHEDDTKQIQRLNNKVRELQEQLTDSKVTPYDVQDIQFSKQQSWEKQQVEQLKREMHQLSLKNDVLISQLHSLETQLQYKSKQNEHLNEQVSELSALNQQLNQENQQSNKENMHLVETLNIIEQTQNNNNNRSQAVESVNVSKEIQLKQQYLSILEQTKQELNQNQVELQSTFNQLQSKITQLKIKDNQISQLKSTLKNNQTYTNYLQTTNQQLLAQKHTLINKNREIQHLIKSLQNTNHQVTLNNQSLQNTLHQHLLQIKVLQQQKLSLEQELRSMTIEKEQDKNMLNLQKKSSAEHFYDCNDQKQILQQELRDTKKSLESAKNKSQQYIQEIKNLTNQNRLLKTSLERSSPLATKSNFQQINNNNSNNQLQQLKRQNQQLQQKVNEKSAKLQEKSKKLQNLQSKLRSEYLTRIKALQQEIYRLSLDETKNKNQPVKSQPILIDLKDDDELMIDDLDQEFQLEQNKLKTNNVQATGKQYVPQTDNKRDSKELQRKDSSTRQKQLYPELGKISSQQSGDYKVKYQELRVQNDSLQAHLQRLSDTLSETKQKLYKSQNDNQKLIDQIQKLQDHSSILEAKLKSLQKQLIQSKQQIQRYQSLKQLLKIQKQQSKQKSQQITQQQQKLSKLQKQHKQLKQDYINLQSISEQASQKHKKTMQNLIKQMTQMKEQILKGKSYIEEKKKQMKRIENDDYIVKINLIDDENLLLKSKVKKLELQNTKLEQRIKEVEEEQLEKAIITRGQLANFKQTQQRLEELQLQINFIVMDKNKIINEKKSLQKYFEEQIELIKSNYAGEREKLIKRLTQIEQVNAGYQIKVEKLKQIIQSKRKQSVELQSNLERITKQNYHIKLQLSQALSETNVQLVKNKTLGERLQTLEQELEHYQMTYQQNVFEKNKLTKDKFSQNTTKMELDMANRQIEKLNDVLMEKEKQINYLLNNKPTNDKQQQMNFSNPNQKLNAYYTRNANYNMLFDRNSRQKSTSRDTPYSTTEQRFVQQPQTEAHYRIVKSQIPKYKDFVKQQKIMVNNNPPRYEKNLYEIPNTKRDQHSYNNTLYHYPPQPQKLIGGFPLEFCSFTPEYHKI